MNSLCRVLSVSISMWLQKKWQRSFYNLIYTQSKLTLHGTHHIIRPKAFLTRCKIFHNKHSRHRHSQERAMGPCPSQFNEYLRKLTWSRVFFNRFTHCAISAPEDTTPYKLSTNMRLHKLRCQKDRWQRNLDPKWPTHVGSNLTIFICQGTEMTDAYMIVLSLQSEFRGTNATRRGRYCRNASLESHASHQRNSSFNSFWYGWPIPISTKQEMTTDSS